MGWIPVQGTKIPCAVGPLSPHIATTEPLHSHKRSHKPQLRPDATKNTFKIFFKNRKKNCNPHDKKLSRSNCQQCSPLECFRVLLIHSTADVLLLFEVLTNKVAMYVLIHVFRCTYIYMYMKYILRIKISDTFKSRKYCENISQINLHSHQLCVRSSCSTAS